MPCRAMTLISTACSWVNILSGRKAAMVAQVGQFYFDAVGQYYSGANTHSRFVRLSEGQGERLATLVTRRHATPAFLNPSRYASI